MYRRYEEEGRGGERRGGERWGGEGREEGRRGGRLECWEHDPKKRLSSEELVAILEDV